MHILGGRERVIMFDENEALRDMMKLPDDKRIRRAKEYYTKIETNAIPEDFPIVALEPKDSIDIAKQFYLLPILAHAPIDIGENEIEGRFLKVASAPKTGRGESGTLEHSEEAISPEAEAEILKEMEIDIVYVMDITGSMQPYIDITQVRQVKIATSLTSGSYDFSPSFFGTTSLDY